MKTKKIPRRERERIRQRQEILSGALRLFSEKGYHNVSMQEIAEETEFATGTLYKFFINKEDLYKAIVTEESETFSATLTAVIEAPGDEVEKLRNYVKAKGGMFREKLPFIRLYLAESRGVSFNINAGLDVEMRQRYHGLLDRLAEVFRSGIASGRFRKIADPYQLAVAFDSTIISFLLLWLDAPERYPYPENPDDILNIFFQGLVNP